MKTIFFDLETQYLYKELGMYGRDRDPSKLKLAVAGTLSDNQDSFFHENEVKGLVKILDRADLIVGHNLFRFDYRVIQPYTDIDVIEMFKSKTFDMLFELQKLTQRMISLDDLCKRNLGMSKNEDTLKIPKMWRNGKHQEVKEYLHNDLKMTEALYHYGKNNKKLKYEHKEYGRSFGIKEIEVDW